MQIPKEPLVAKRNDTDVEKTAIKYQVTATRESRALDLGFRPRRQIRHHVGNLKHI